MTIEIRQAARELAEILRSRFSPQRQVSHDVIIEEVIRDTEGQAISAIATINGVTGQRLAVPYGARITPGMQVTAINYGTPTSPNWVLSEVLTGFGAPPVTEFLEDTTIGSASFGAGDSLFGNVGQTYIHFDASTGEVRSVSGSQTVERVSTDGGYIYSQDLDSGSTVFKRGNLTGFPGTSGSSWGWAGGDLSASSTRFIAALITAGEYLIKVSGGNVLIYDTSGCFCGGLFSASELIPGAGSFAPGDIVLGIPREDFPNVLIDRSASRLSLRTGSQERCVITPSGIVQLELEFTPSASMDAIRKDYLDQLVPSGTQVGQVHYFAGTGSFGAYLPLTDAAGWLVEERSGIMLVVDER